MLSDEKAVEQASKVIFREVDIDDHAIYSLDNVVEGITAREFMIKLDSVDCEWYQWAQLSD